MTRRPSVAVGAALLLALGCGGGDRPPGTITGPARPAADVAESAARQRAVAPAEADGKQILFGDLHVHTTYSLDAFAMELPLTGLQGVHTPADACDFARHCAKLDFFSLDDHAESLTPAHWTATKDVVRRCNALAGDPANQDLIAFVGWEWTQVGSTAETHWGHRNVIFRDLDDAALPARPISARDPKGIGLFNNVGLATKARFIDPVGWNEYRDLEWLLEEVRSQPLCPTGVPSRDLPADCHETAATPADLYAKLDEWGAPVLVIPHGNAWGLYTPPGASWDKALTAAQHDPTKQRLLEVMSGHGNSEEYRAFRPGEVEADGETQCPEPTAEFLPCCWQAGEIVRARCGDLPAAECDARVAEARRLAVLAGASVRQVLPDAPADAWLDCDQCRDCFKPSFSLRPRESAQYAMSLANFDERAADGRPLRFEFGFIASTDDHTARPGTGYKQYERRMMTFATGGRSGRFLLLGGSMDDPRTPERFELPYVVPDAERVASFSYPGGIVAVHAEARSRDALWSALERREVYGTSGPRILLWFDLLNPPEGGARRPMGSRVAMATAPRFEVRAAGDFVQHPGCPDSSRAALDPDRLAYLCAGECYHPGDVRHPITHVEVVRIRRQSRPGESVDGLIEDPWKRLACPPGAAPCVVSFTDDEYPTFPHDVVYYVRALQEPTPAINGANLRTRFDGAGNPTAVEPCWGDYRTPFDDDCLAPVAERAWSSPIFVDRPLASG